MEFKKCEHCGEEIHIRSQKCPFCNQTVSNVPEEIIRVEDTNANETESKLEENEIKEETIPQSEDMKNIYNGQTNAVNFVVGNNGEPKDYVYKAEVRHSLEYTNPMSNTVKVFVSALCTLPILGQVIGAFLGVFFSTYEDTDRRSFGRALILLSIFMFVLYIAYFKYAFELLSTIDANSLQNLLGQ